MKKRIYSQLLHLSAAALTCATLLAGNPSAMEPGAQGKDRIPVTETQDGASGAEDDDNAKNGKEPKPEDPGIQPQCDWNIDDLKN